MTLQVLGIDPAATKGAVLSRLGVGSTVIGKDGRKPAGWRDRLEVEIFGNWEWSEGHVAGDGAERSQRKGSGRHGAQWIPLKDVEEVSGTRKPFGDSTVDDALQTWGDDLPQTRLVNHVSGYTTLDNVYIFNGSVYLVTDSGRVFPPMDTMVKSVGQGFGEWKILSTDEARKTVGKYGSTIRGVSWMSADSQPHNSTLFALWRTYSSLDTSIDSAGRTGLPPPRRLIFPHNYFFTDDNPPFEQHWVRRKRVDTGFHPYTVKAAFPQLSMMFLQDWEDYEKMEIPFVFERLVVADRSVAAKAAKEDEPVYAPVMLLDASEHWWEPVRKNLAQYLDAYEVKPKAKKVVTYLHTQTTNGPKLSAEDHEALAKALSNMAWKWGCEVNVVSAQTEETDWTTRMTAVVKSSVIVGVHGNHLMDSVFMRRTPQSTLLELFPTDKFVRDRELAVHSVGLHYLAMRGNSAFSTELPHVSPPKDDESISIDLDAILRNIHEALSRT